MHVSSNLQKTLFKVNEKYLKCCYLYQYLVNVENTKYFFYVIEFSGIFAKMFHIFSGLMNVELPKLRHVETGERFNTTCEFIRITYNSSIVKICFGKFSLISVVGLVSGKYNIFQI